tara:strand:- start:3316 stop:3636 length:321 start_codon:yes stop_codon:yes gene_type:complete
MKKEAVPSNKKVVLIGIPNPIKLKSKKYVIKKLYEKAKKNPFLSNNSYEEYLEFLKNQIEELGNMEVDTESECIEYALYNALKKIKWLKVVNVFVVGFIQATNTGG